MNERIRELAEQAKIKVWHDGGGLLSDKAFEIVAELIVRECVLISRTSTDGFSAGRRMEESFGVDSKSQ